MQSIALCCKGHVAEDGMEKAEQKTKTRTIADIARLANVSPSTVSRALSDSPLISAETRERIQAIAREHNFTVHAGAQNLRMQRTQTLAAVVSASRPHGRTLTDPFLLELLGEIAAAAAAREYDLLLSESHADSVDWHARFLRSGRADGMILIPRLSERLRQAGSLASMGAPFVVWGPAVASQAYCSIGSDDYQGGRMATEHLIQLGRQRIALLGSDPECLEIKLRYDGYAAALAAAGRSVEPRNTVNGHSTSQAGYEAMRRLLVQTPNLDAVVVMSDVMALGALEALRTAGRSVPGDIAVVGYDDISLAAYCSPPLTTVRQNVPAAGTLLVERLLAAIEGRPAPSVVLPVELVIRQSCGALAG
jgi:DNA-binding LacI/PurR family transcriptional regulator